MSVYYNQTNIAPGTSQFITRTEVIDALSTIASDLSGQDIPSLFKNPNPQFSTITMNPSGTVTGASFMGASSGLGISSVITTYNRMFASAADPFLLGTRADPGTAYQPEVLGQLWLKNNIFTNEATTVISPTNFAYATGIGTTYPVIQYNTAATQVALSNISSINGNPPSGATTFTNLTGSNLTTTGTLTSPQMVSLSSINGVIYQIPYSAAWNGGGSVSLTSGTPAVVGTMTLPANYFQTNTTYIYDVPVKITSWPPGSPTGFNMFLGIRLGGNGQINYQTPLYIENSSQGIILSLTGIAQTNSSSLPTTQNIDIIALQSSGQTFTPTIQSPTTGGGLNIYTIKPLS